MTIPDEVEQLFCRYDSARHAGTHQAFFEILPAHIALLRRLCAYWSYSEDTPTINAIRPYGNSDIELDISEICGLPIPDPEKETWTPEQLRNIAFLHRGMGIVLEIMLQCGQLAPGMYTFTLPGTWNQVKGN